MSSLGGGGGGGGANELVSGVNGLKGEGDLGCFGMNLLLSEGTRYEWSKESRAGLDT